MIIAIGTRLIVDPSQGDLTTPGGVIVVETVQLQKQGQVVSIGDDVIRPQQDEGEYIREGDTVIYLQHREVPFHIGGKKYVSLGKDDILAVVSLRDPSSDADEYADASA